MPARSASLTPPHGFFRMLNKDAVTNDRGPSRSKQRCRSRWRAIGQKWRRIFRAKSSAEPQNHRQRKPDADLQKPPPRLRSRMAPRARFVITPTAPLGTRDSVTPAELFALPSTGCCCCYQTGARAVKLLNVSAQPCPRGALLSKRGNAFPRSLSSSIS